MPTSNKIYNRFTKNSQKNMKTQLQDFGQLKTLTFKGKEIVTLIPADMHAHEVMCEQGGKEIYFV